MLNNRSKIHFIFLRALMTFMVLSSVTFDALPSWAQSPSTNEKSMEINGDEVEYSLDGELVIVQGDVVIVYGENTLYADQAELSRSTNVVYATGNVRLVSPYGEIAGEKMTYNFETEKGDLNGATFYSHPYFGGGRYAAKVDSNKFVVKDGYFTTSDFDKPEYRLTSNKIEIYPGDKLVARHVRLMLGNIPIFYLPKYTQDLTDREPRFSFAVGSTSEWGDFLLTKYKIPITDNIEAALHADYRVRRGFASGLDVDYNTQDFGQGVVRTYYTHERLRDPKHLWSHEWDEPTTERERYKAEWRHKWRIDPRTQFIAQYYKLSDADFLKDFFEKEFKRSSNPDTFFLLTRGLDLGTLSLRVDKRVNRFVGDVERLPELAYNLSSTEIADSGLFLSHQSSFSKLVKKFASPSERRFKTYRFYTDNQLDYPMKIGFIEFKPFIGTEQTYYSRTARVDEEDQIRGLFKTGITGSTKFYRIYNVHFDKFGFDINRLRHVITPSITYDYTSGPTIPNSELNSYDTIDSRTQQHKIVYSIENKFQTKRDEQSVDLLRSIISLDYLLKEHPGKTGFNKLNADLEIRPTEWLDLYFDATYDTRNDRINDANVDVYIHDEDQWRFGFSNRYARNADNILTTNFSWKINPKWKMDVYERVDIENGDHEEFDFIITRDLHSWELDFQYNTRRKQGVEVLFVFRLKAFPDISFGGGNTFNEPRRRPGSQN